MKPALAHDRPPTGRSHPRAAVLVFCSLLMAALALPAPAQVLKLNDKQEIEVGKRAAAMVESSEPLFTYPTVSAYLQKVGIRLARKSGRPGRPDSFQILDSSDVNAYVLPAALFTSRAG